MKNYYFLLVCILITNMVAAQSSNVSFITHKTKGFIKAPNKYWIDINEHKLPQNVKYEPQLFLWSAVDTTDFRKDDKGYKYFNTKLYFGFKDQSEFYEIKEPVYAGTGNKYRTHCLSWRFNSFYLLTNDLINGKKRDVVLFRLDKDKVLSKSILNSKPTVGNYANIYDTEKNENNYMVVNYLDEDNKTQELIYIKDFFFKIGTTELDTIHTKRTEKDIAAAKNDKDDPLKYYSNIEELILSKYNRMSNPDYDHKEYLLSKKEVLMQSVISHKYENQNVSTFNTTALQNSDKDGWQSITDLYNRNTTPLFFQLKTDKTNFKTDSKGRNYYKTFIRFGFDNETVGYQLSGSFYIMEKQDRYLSGLDKLQMFYKNPCLMFTNETFYVFVPNFIGQDMQDATMFTYSINKGIVRENLWKGKVEGSGFLPYFTDYDTDGFALIHSEEAQHNLFKTFQKDGKWMTINIDLSVYEPILENTYLDQIQPYFLALKPEKFRVPTDEYSKSEYYNPFLHTPIFTNSVTDQQRYQSLLKSKVNKWDINYQLGPNNIVYKELPHTTLLVPFMPKTKMNHFAQCHSYAFAALYKQFIDSDWQVTQMRKVDPNALKKETDISYFGMQQYLRGNKNQIDPANLWMYPKALQEEIISEMGNKELAFKFTYDDDDGKGSYYSTPFEIVLQNQNNLDAIFDNIVAYYKSKNIPLTEMYDKFQNYLLQLYESNKKNVKPNNRYSTLISEIHDITGIPITNIDLQKAFNSPSLETFYYLLFFNNCTDSIPLLNRNNLSNIITQSSQELKEKIVEILISGKPILITIYRLPNDTKDKQPHSLLICGYKKVINPKTGKIEDVFKLHNNWGEEWDFETNDGWFLADNIINSTYNQIEFLPGLKSLSKDWVENTPDYKRIYNNTYSEFRLKIQPKVVGNTKGSNQKDAEPLYKMIGKPGYDYKQASSLFKSYFMSLGYTFKSEDSKTRELYFDGLEIWLQRDGTYIICPNEADLETLKSKMDFSKIKGKFVQNVFSDGGYYIKLNKD